MPKQVAKKATQRAGSMGGTSRKRPATAGSRAVVDAPSKPKPKPKAVKKTTQRPACNGASRKRPASALRRAVVDAFKTRPPTPAIRRAIPRKFAAQVDVLGEARDFLNFYGYRPAKKSLLGGRITRLAAPGTQLGEEIDNIFDGITAWAETIHRSDQRSVRVVNPRALVVFVSLAFIHGLAAPLVTTIAHTAALITIGTLTRVGHYELACWGQALQHAGNNRLVQRGGATCPPL